MANFQVQDVGLMRGIQWVGILMIGMEKRVPSMSTGVTEI